MNALMNPSAPLTMSSREIAELTGKEHRNVMRDIRTMLDEIKEDVLKFERMLPDRYGRPQPVFELDREMTELLLTGYSVELRRRVLARWRELEEQQKAPFPDLSTDEGKLLVIQDLATKQLVLIQEKKELTEKLDTAIRTKAEIGSRREATAMATASAKAREVARLKEELGRNQAHATVKVVEKMTRKAYDWRPLKKYCADVGLQPRKVVDEQYGTVNAWPAIAWRNVHGVDLEMLFPSERGA